MGERAEAGAEGSGIFESLFGGFSNGLSIFTNNPFRRKNDDPSSCFVETDEGNNNNTALKRLAGESHEEAEKVLVKKHKKINPSIDRTLDLFESKKEILTDGLDLKAAAESKENSESSQKKAKRADEDLLSEKKRSKTESVDEALKTGSSESRKRKQELANGTKPQLKTDSQDTTEEVDMKKKKKKKKQALGSDGHTTCTANNSQNEVLAPTEGPKEIKLGKTATRDGPEGEQQEQEEQELVGQKVKRLVELEVGGEQRKKKTKRAEDTHMSKPEGTTTEELLDIPLGVETRSGSKRKKDSDLEETYERKRRDFMDGKKSSRNGEHGGAVGETGTVDRLRGKRRLSLDEEEGGGKGLKKTRTSTEDKIFEPEDRLTRTIFVGNVPVTVKPKQLSREFRQYGAVESSRLRSVPLVDSKMPRKAAVITGQLNEARTSLNGYVVFEKEESARAALAHNMKEFKGKHLRVDMATAPRRLDKGGESGIEYDRSRSIFVGNLPFDVEDEEIYSLFQGKTPDLEVEAVRVIRDPQTSFGKGFAFVCFKKKVGATTALANAEYTRLRNRQLRIIRFGFQKKQTWGNLPARSNAENNRSKPRPGAEERLSRRGVLSYEGKRASRGDGQRKGTERSSARKGKVFDRASSSPSTKPVKKHAVAPTKRPAVAARKLASQGKAPGAGASRTGGGAKRKREEKGKVDPKGKRRKPFRK